MITKAQITTIHSKLQKPYQPTNPSAQTLHSRQRRPKDYASAQNKPNFKNTKMNTKPVETNLYENFRPCEDMQNKPNSNPIKANSNAYFLSFGPTYIFCSSENPQPPAPRADTKFPVLNDPVHNSLLDHSSGFAGLASPLWYKNFEPALLKYMIEIKPDCIIISI